MQEGSQADSIKACVSGQETAQNGHAQLEISANSELGCTQSIQTAKQSHSFALIRCRQIWKPFNCATQSSSSDSERSTPPLSTDSFSVQHMQATLSCELQHMHAYMQLVLPSLMP